MKSKFTKIQNVLKKGMAITLCAMFMATPITYAVTSLDDSYLQGSVLDQMLYGTIGSTVKEIEEWFEENTTLYITNETQLRAFAEYVNNGNDCSGKKIILINDIELSSNEEWVPIGRKDAKFKGTFDGQGFTISKLKFNRGDKSTSEIIGVGLFGYIENAIISNVNISDSQINIPSNLETDAKFFENSTEYKYWGTGAVVGISRDSHIENCTIDSNVTVTGLWRVAGIVGSFYGGMIDNCYNNGTISGVKQVGGIAGFAQQGDKIFNWAKEESAYEVIIINCKNTGHIKAKAMEAGGIVGAARHETIIQKCINTGKIETDQAEFTVNDKKIHVQNVGGIAGWIGGQTVISQGGAGTTAGETTPLFAVVDSCINEGSVYGYADVGGLVGQIAGEGGGYALLSNSINYSTDINGATNKKGYLTGNAGEHTEGSHGFVFNNYYMLKTNPQGNVVTAKNEKNSPLYLTDENIKTYETWVHTMGDILPKYQYVVLNPENSTGFLDAYGLEPTSVLTICSNTGYIRQVNGKYQYSNTTEITGDTGAVTVVGESRQYKLEWNDDVNGCAVGLDYYVSEDNVYGRIMSDWDGVYFLKQYSFTTNSSNNKVEIINDNSNVSTDLGNASVTYELYKDEISEENKIKTQTYLKAGDKIIVEAKFDKYLAEKYGPLGAISKTQLNLKINNNSNYEMECTSVNANSTTYTTTIVYEYVIKDTDNFNLTTLNLSKNGTIYAVEADDKNESGSYNVPSTISKSSVSTNASNITVDTIKPTINTKVYVENKLEPVVDNQERYTAGKEIKFQVTTSEEINPYYTLPEIRVSFSESGIGKYNYSKEKGAGFAKCIDAVINEDKTTTWTYSYIVQERDEGQLEFIYTDGIIKDWAGNETDIKDLYTPSTDTTSEVVSGNSWPNDLGVTYEFYKNSVSAANKVTSQTYFTEGDDLVVVATYDKVLYVLFGIVNNGDYSEPFSSSHKANAPSIYLNSEVNLKAGTAENVSIINNRTNTKIQYRFTDIAKEYGLTTLTQVSNISSKNDNNYDKTVGQVTLNGPIGYSENYYTQYTDENAENVKYLSKNAIIKTEELDDVLIDPIGVSEKIEKSDIYADTTAPTVTITADKPNPTNADLIKYTFKFSEVVEGFTADDITVNGGEKAKETVQDGEETREEIKFTEVTEGLEYTLEVEPSITAGNEGILQVIVEEGAVKDLVAINNVRQECNITIDKVKPTFTSYEVKEQSGKVIIDLTFSEEISDASELIPTLTVGGKEARGEWEDVEIYDNNKVKFVYNKDGMDGGKVEVALAGTVKDVAGNDSEELNIQVENDIILVQNVIKDGTDIYSFKKGNTSINNFANRTYFTKGNTIKVTKISPDPEEEGKTVSTTYSYVIQEDLDLTHMKYMNLVDPEEGQTTGTAVFSTNRTSGSIDISEANIWFDTIGPKVFAEITANNPVSNNVYGEASELTIKATTSEEIREEETTIPEISVKFAGKAGKFNNGKAEYVEAVKNENGTTTWIYRYIVTTGDEGEVSLRYESGRLKDLAGNTLYYVTNLNQEEDIFTLNNIVADTTIPTVTITTDKSNPTNADKIVYTFEFSEVVNGFTVEDVTVNNASKGTFTRVTEGLKYTLEVTPTISSGNEGDVQVIVEQNSCTDRAGLGNVRAENVIKVDKKAPTVEIKANKDKVNGTEKITYEFIWSESVTGFAAADITVVNGTKGTFTGEGNYYTLEVTPSGANDVEVSVAEGKCIDTANNNNIASSKHVIAVVPSVTIKTDRTNPTKENTITYTFEWSEPVTGFDVSDIILPNGVTGTLNAGTNNTYTMTINYNGVIPLGNEGEVIVAVKENAAQDTNGNYNAYASNTTKIDRIAPIFIGLESYAESTIKLDSNVDTVKQYYKAGDSVTIIATFTENIEKSTAPVLVLEFSESGNAKGSVSAGTKQGNKITYTYTITNEDEGTLSVKGFSGKVVDAAGNETVATKRELTGDAIIADTTAPRLVGITAIAPDFEYDELLQDGETKRYGVTSKTRDNNTITIVAEYSENVYSLNSNTINKITTVPRLSIKFGTGTQRQIATGTAQGNKITYTYNIQSGDNGALSIVSLNGTVADIAGNTLTTNTSLPVLVKYEMEIAEGNEIDSITADTTRSSITFNSVTAVNYDDNGNRITGNGSYYRKGAVITITASTNEYVYKNTDKSLVRFTNENAPTLNISFATSGTGVGTCSNVEYKDNKTVFTYTYTVKENDNGQISLSIAENVGYDIALNGNYTKSETKSIYADTVNPVTNWQSWVESEGYGIVDNLNGTWEVTFSETLYVYDNSNYVVGSVLTNKSKAPVLLVSKDNTTALETTITNITVNDDGKTVITYRYADYTKNMGAYGMKFASVSDKAGNLFNLKDQVAPRLEKIEVVSPVTGTYKAGEAITIVATFNEKLNENSIAPTLTLAFTDSGDAKGTVSQGVISGNTITYTYTITARDNKGNGDNGVLYIQSYTGTGLKDLSDNVWAGETKSLTGNRITADTIAPVITKVEAKVDENVIGSYVQNPELYVTGRTNADTISYIVTFSENITLINEDVIEITNGKITNITHKDNTITVTVKTTTEGVQSLIIPEEVVEDVAGNTNEFFRFNGITTDFTKPTVRFISEYNGGEYVLPTGVGKIEIRPNVEINEDISKIEYKWDNGEYTPIEKYSGVSDIVVPTKEFAEAGEYTLSIRVTDIAGNVAVASKEYTVLNSGINITAKNEGIADDATNKLPPVNGDVIVTVEFGKGLTDNRKVLFKAEGSSEYTAINPETNGYRITENGTVYAEATDKLGNKVFYLYGNEVGYPITNIDRQAPVIEFSEVPYGILKGEPIDIYIDADESADIEYSWNNQEWTKYEDKITHTFEVTGEIKLYAKAIDEAGNESTSELTIYVSALEFEVYGNTDYWTAGDVELYVSTESEITSIKVNEVSINVDDRTYIAQENGDYVFVVTDKYGNTATKTIRVEKIDKDSPIIENVEVDGKEITITAKDDKSGIEKYAITSTSEVPVEWSESNVIKTTKDGTFYAWVKDNVGNVARAENAIVIDTTAPIITFSYTSLTVTVGMPLETNILTNEDAIISYSWDNKTWVDSEELLNSLIVSEKSTTTGEYILYVKAKDNNENESKVQTLKFNVVNVEEIRQPEIIFEDIPTIQINGVKYVKVSSDMTTQGLTNKMDQEALCGKTPEYTKLTEDKDLKTGSEIAINGSTKYIVVVEGDINCDGEVTFDDIIKTNAVRISGAEDNITKAQLLAVDINNTAKIEFKDIISINAIRINSANLS